MSNRECPTCRHLAVPIAEEPCSSCDRGLAYRNWQPKPPAKRKITDGLKRGAVIHAADALMRKR